MSTFQEEIDQYDYRQIIVDIVNKMTTIGLRKRIMNLKDDQIEVEVEVEHQEICTTDVSRTKMIEFYCRVIWNWGWGGCDYFTKKNRHLLRN
jgi:hypothetical protein